MTASARGTAEQEAIFMAQAFDQSTIVTKSKMDAETKQTTPTTTPTTPESNAPQVIAAMLEVRRTRERIKSDYREVADQFKSKIRLLDDTLAGLFECLDDAEGGQLSLFEVDFALPPEVQKLLGNA
jgi:hypothetical protein